MKLHLIAVGDKMPQWVDAAFGEYAKRMPRELRLELVEVKAEKRASGKSVAQVQTLEAQRILAALPAKSVRVVLDERGEQVTTVQLARWLEVWMQGGRDVTFVIGGADGLDAGLKQSAEKLLAVSAMTLPHGLVRVLLAEQLYRAASIIAGHPYHRK
ncbi:MAG: 23S rRNA (pseudouridine(1915)-N(3))-methyltransferase RlmH [Pseudomonadota bacterium]|jgi:23S rRNA (pseudouridine1915-N3)-methyltransferase